MKTLVVYYSRTGITKKIAEAIKNRLNCDIEEIISVKDRAGVVGYFISGKEATQKISAEIRPITRNPVDYDLVVLGTPIWAWNISSPLRGYIMKNHDKFKEIAGFCTMGGSGDKQAFAEIEKLCSKKLIAKLGLLTKEVQLDNFIEKINSYCATLGK